MCLAVSDMTPREPHPVPLPLSLSWAERLAPDEQGKGGVGSRVRDWVASALSLALSLAYCHVVRCSVERPMGPGSEEPPRQQLRRT